ncbi:MAG: 6-bladed beta-propeller [Candidatus Aminicenantes bacterium]|nr:6-bladed beta-propeller [Candidatus Aminicenantes bacterium]
MKKLIYLGLILSLFSYCGHKQERVDKIIEDGVEVVLNHLEPYKIKGEPTAFSLEKEFTIDTERNDIAEFGLADVDSFTVDLDGNIYILSPKSGEKVVFKFDWNGNFVMSFGQKGQGPGEVQWPTSLRIHRQKEIAVTDSHHKFLIFSNEGELIRETGIVSTFIAVATPLDNGNHLIIKQLFEPRSEYIMQRPLILADSGLQDIKELERYKYPNYMTKKRFNGLVSDVIYSISKEKIYVGNADRGYEICVYDLKGNLLKKIRKEYRPIKVPEEVKIGILKRYEDSRFEAVKEKIYFPDSMPPYKSFFTDESGRLFVMIHEKGKKPGEYMFDIFNEDGIFMGKKSLDGFIGRAMIRQNRLYCLREKDSGYKKLVVYQINWE